MVKISKALLERNAKFRKSPLRPSLLRRELARLLDLRRINGQSDTSIAEFLKSDGFNACDGLGAGYAVGFKMGEYVTMGNALQTNPKTGEDFKRHPQVLRPIDATKEEIAAYLKEHHRARKALAKRRRTEERTNSVVHLMDCRPSAILLALTFGWQTTTALMRRLQGSAAFGKLTGKALNTALMRELRKPALSERIEMRLVKARIKYARHITEIRRKP